MVDGIIEDMNAKTRPPISSVHDLALLIINRCSGAFDRHRINDQNYQFLEMFGSSIGSIADEESQLFRNFDEACKKWIENKGDSQSLRRDKPGESRHNAAEDRSEFNENSSMNDQDKLQYELLNIARETSLLTEIKDIQDELRIIKVILDCQSSVLRNFEASLELEDVGGGRYPVTWAAVVEIYKCLEVNQKDRMRVDGQTASLYNGLMHLLDLKQKHCNALEARFAGEQAAVTAKQGQSILVITIVTIVFLPLSFIASFFSIDIDRWVNGLTVGYVSKYIFGIGLGISIPLIVMALTLSEIRRAVGVATLGAGRWLYGRRQCTDNNGSSRKFSQGEEPVVTDHRRQSAMRPNELRRILSPFGNGRHAGEDLERDGVVVRGVNGHSR